MAFVTTYVHLSCSSALLLANMEPPFVAKLTNFRVSKCAAIQDQELLHPNTAFRCSSFAELQTTAQNGVTLKLHCVKPRGGC